MIEPITVPINEAIAITGLGKTTIYKQIKLGKLEMVKVGAKTLITMCSIKQLLTKREAA